MDKEFDKILKKEIDRENNTVELIASENFVSDDVLAATGTIFTNKYAEGYPGKRYYGGCEYVDELEVLAQERLKKLFNAKFVNVQPHSGSQANAAVYMGLLNPGDIILGMSLDSGGHLTHGYKITQSGTYYKSATYSVNEETELIDYDEVLKIAEKIKPKLIICGYSAYPRKFSFEKFSEIAKKVGAYLMADIAHIAGIIAVGLHESPMEFADVVTSTTHKTLRGARGGIIMTNNEEIFKKINRGLFPGTQGGPLMNQIAGKAVSFQEALQPSFKKYIENVLINAKTMSDFFSSNNCTIVSGGTDNHLFLINVLKSYSLNGQEAEDLLSFANIVVNKNSIPYDDLPPNLSSGIRIGTAAMTTKGWTKNKFIKLSEIINEILLNKTKEYASSKKTEVLDLLYN